MCSECIVFIIDKIPVFIFCDRWFPGTLAVGSASCRRVFFFFFVFALMWPITALAHVAGHCNRIPRNRSA